MDLLVLMRPLAIFRFTNELIYGVNEIVRVIDGQGSVSLMGREEVYTGFWCGNRRERDHWGDIGVDWWIILRRISRRWDVD